MEKLHFTKSEVLAYLEDKILSNMATEDELEMYQDYKWDRKLNKNNYTYKKLIREMREWY
jgi:competence protein ComGF